MLLVGDRVVLRAAVPPEAEYAMFELADIELRASEPGRVREHGYQTTVDRAKQRLAQLGITSELARECASSMQPTISDAYARGSAVRHVARYLGALELLQADAYDGTSYRGVFLDLGALARDVRVDAADATLQALYLAALLEGEADDTTVFLSTEGWTRQRKPGERTHKRPTLCRVAALRSALEDLARTAPKPEIGEPLARADVIAFLRARADATADPDMQALYGSLERAVAVRDIPDKGPLSDPALWRVELLFDAGSLEGIVDAVDELERARGRTPGTTYLRARASLALRLEPPKLVAERISALALSMTSFQELSLLAAEAWLEAGDPRRAMPYARDLVDAPGIDEGLLLKAQRLLARAVGAAPAARKRTLVDSLPAGPMPPSRPPPARPSAPPVSAPDPGIARTFEPAQSRVPTVRGAAETRPATSPGLGAVTPPQPEVAEPEARTNPPPPPAPLTSSPPPLPSRPPAAPAPVTSLPPLRSSRRPEAARVEPSEAPPPLELDLPPPMDPAASFTLDLPPPPEAIGPALAEPPPPPPPPRTSPPPPEEALRSSSPPRPVSAPPSGGPRPSGKPSRRRMTGARVETVAPAALADPRAEPDTPMPRASRAPLSSVRPPPRSEGRAEAPLTRPPEPETGTRPTPLRPPTTEEARRESMRPQSGAPGTSSGGASLPPYRVESPAPLLSRAPLFPKLGGPADELAEHLALPPGLGGEVLPVETLPRSVLEARVQFTLLSRELGLDYRLKRGIELRADVSGIEAMQAVLLESFPDHVVRTTEEAYEVRRHGALLSEILARRLDAEWVDITPSELGYWAMIVPPDTRVWPFGRVARLIAKGHKERDLVSYFLELSARTRA